MLEKAVTKARDDEGYARQFEETLLRDPPSRSASVSVALATTSSDRDTPPYYPHHDAVNGIDCALYAILFDAAHPDAEQSHE